MAEVMSLRSLLIWIRDNFSFKKGEVIEILGDNKLCI